MKKVILFELNEVPLRIVQYFIHARPDSTLARLFPRAKKFETVTEDAGELSPWITWPSLHRGVPNSKHYIQNFGQPVDEVDREFPPIWKLLADKGISVGVFGSLHTYPPPKSFENYRFFIPDVFASGSECFPKSIEAYQAFNLRMSRESARNVSARVPFKEAIGVLSNLSELGFKPRTVVDVARQLVEERLDRWKVVRRRTFQTVLAFDIFVHQLAKTRPDFTTFFTNHVASSLHRYWAAAFPEDYDEVGYDTEWLRTFNKEILFTMEKADEMLARLVRFVDLNPEFQLMVATSMGQKATLANPVETKLYIVNAEAFMTRLGVANGNWEKRPAMLPQFNVQVSGNAAAGFKRQLERLSVNGEQISFVREGDGFFSITMGHTNIPHPVLSFDNANIPLEELGIANVEITDKSGTTAYHIPEGALLIYDPSMPQTAEITRISTLDVSPYLLTNFGQRVPNYMGGRAYSLV